MKKNVSIISIIMAIVFILIVGNQEMNKILPDFCNKNSDDFAVMKSKIKTSFPIGSSATKLEDEIGSSKGYDRLWHRKKTPDLAYGIEPKFYASVYAINCKIKNKNTNQWYILFIADSNKKITGLEFHLFFEDENFEKRGIDFKSENFRGGQFAKKALWSITGVGTSRAKIRQIMKSAGITEHHELKGDGYGADVFRKTFDVRSLGPRLGGGDSRIFVWKYDLSDKLLELDIR